jgi:signal transduction histidine kinase
VALRTLIDPALVTEMLALKQGEHLCLIYRDDPAEQLGALLPFISQGLRNGEQCVYIADDQTVDELRDSLKHYGIDTAEHESSGALQLWTRDEWRQPGELNSVLKAEQVRGIIDRALNDGYAGIRFCVEMTWTLGPDIDVKLLRHWEATLNDIVTPQTPVRIVCQYSRSRLNADVIQAGIITHPLTVIDGDVCTNQFYEAPIILNGGHSRLQSGPEAVDWMISQLRWTRAYEREREERIRAEAALSEAEARKAQIAELLRRAEASQEEMRNALTIKDEFLGLVSHELRTPIATIMGNALLLQRRGHMLAKEDCDQAMADIANEGQRLQRIIENLLVLTRTEAPSVLNMEPLLLQRLMPDFVEAFGRRRPERKVTLECPTSLPLAQGEPTLLAQTVDNLLTNADKYSPSDQPIEVMAEATEDGGVAVRVRDHGEGLSEDALERIFDAFYRAPSARNKASGMGLGLAVCRRVMEAQGGKIWAETRPEGGCDFVFTVPPATLT